MATRKALNMPLTNADIVELTEFRRMLHRHPEVSGQEAQTAQFVQTALASLGPDTVLSDLGGHGVAAVYDSGNDGPTVMIRAELDALPITELNGFDHASTIPGNGHLCGHDGHMTILMGLARQLSRQRPKSGRVVLMFQPAEEDGSGAAAVLDDPRFAQIAPDWALSLHNMPGVAMGRAWLAPGPANCASVGLRIAFEGATAHASLPETGRAPTPALARMMTELPKLGPGGEMQPGFRLATITHVTMGAAAFGIAPGAAELWVTLRGLSDTDLAELLAQTTALAEAEATAAGLTVSFTQHDPFNACHNDAEATAILANALDATGIGYDAGDMPMRASEDFGRFGQHGAKAAMVFLGAGLEHPDLHTQHYDFPDELIPKGVALFSHAIDQLLA